jgi:hypothetical protein
LTKIVTLKLNNLPLLPKNEVMSGLQKSLAVFGVIMGVGINTESTTGFFMDSSYAVPEDQKF